MVLGFSAIRRCIWQGLVLFFFQSCSNNKVADLTIVWEKDFPVALKIPAKIISEYPADSIATLLTVHLHERNEAMLGEFELQQGALLFTPLTSLTRGLTYDIQLKSKTVGTITIPSLDAADAPVVKVIYPTQDTLPLNLLKVYLKFSRPMREGQSLKHIVLLKNGKDTMPSVFLDLQPELWDRDRTTLTVWLDPGRIKRDLQPNQRMGPPLEPFISYRLLIRSGWSDIHGSSLRKDFEKYFFVISRDSASPDPDRWKITTPRSGTTQALGVDFAESLDAELIREAIQVTDPDGNFVDGRIELKQEERGFLFTPENSWREGKYVLRCEGRLEDLAGNNLNRPFDRDLRKKNTRGAKEIFIRSLEMQ